MVIWVLYSMQTLALFVKCIVIATQAIAIIFYLIAPKKRNVKNCKQITSLYNQALLFIHYY